MYRTIVVGTDGSATATAAVMRAAALASTCGAALHVVSAYRSPTSTALIAAPEAAVALDDGSWHLAAQAEVDRQLGEVAAAIGGSATTVETHGRAGDPVRVILDVAEEVGADLVVVGNRGMKGMKRVLGSVPNSIAQGVGCDVLVVQTT